MNGMKRWNNYLNWYKCDNAEYGSVLKKRILFYYILVVLIMLGICFSIFKCSEVEEYKPALTHYDKLHVFFKAHNSPVPSVMSVAVLQTKNPNLMAAVAVKESNGTPWAVGDGGSSKGAFQVQSKHWGKVPDSAVHQALQAERILEELVASSPRRKLRRGLAKYNGGIRPARVSYKYADDILKMKGSLT